MKAYTNVTGQTHAQPDGQDWPPGVTLTRWGAADVAALVAYGYVAETQPAQPAPARAARPTPAPAPQAAPAAPEPAPAPAPAPSRRRRKEST